MKVTPEQMRRLAFAKYLYLQGCEQSHLPGPMSAASLLLFHDSIELVLYLSLEVLGGPERNNLSFMEYWPEYKRQTGKELPMRQAMTALNKSRVALKHHATLPSREALERYRVNSSQFLIEVSSSMFDLEFDSLSLVEFVRPENCKQELLLAQNYLDNGDLMKSASSVATAFSMLMSWSEDHYSDEFFDSPFAFGADTYPYTALRSHLNESDEQRDFGRFIEDVSTTLSRVRAAMPILAHGIPYGEFVRFDRYLPRVALLMDGSYHVTLTGRERHANAESLRYCIQFVIEQSIKIQSTMG